MEDRWTEENESLRGQLRETVAEKGSLEQRIRSEAEKYAQLLKKDLDDTKCELTSLKRLDEENQRKLVKATLEAESRAKMIEEQERAMHQAQQDYETRLRQNEAHAEREVTFGVVAGGERRVDLFHTCKGERGGGEGRGKPRQPTWNTHSILMFRLQ